MSSRWTDDGRGENATAETGPMAAIVSRLNSVWPTGGDADGAADGVDGKPGAASAGLYECDTCDVVYIATEKEMCSNCGNEVSAVRSSLRHAAAD